MIAALVAFASALVVTPLPADTAALRPYYAGAIVCQAQTGDETCHLWLNPDGSYQVFYNLGPSAPRPKSASGPFQLEGREGRYRLAIRNGRSELCLTPDRADGWTYSMQERGLLYGGAGCTPFMVRRAGESWRETDVRGRGYTLWLLEGR